MEPDSDKERKEAREAFAEYAIGISLLAKGWDEAAHFSDFPFRVIFIFLAGIFIIVGTKLRRRIEKKIRNFSGFFHVLEGLVEIACGSIMLEKGKHFIPAFLAFIGLIYLSRGLTQLLTNDDNRELAFMRLRLILGIAMIVFAVSMAGINALTDRNIAVFLVTPILVAGGIIAIMRRKSLQPIRLGIFDKLSDLLKRK
jgi:ABC-type multidrug transport system fused ATPase/permease subunit